MKINFFFREISNGVEREGHAGARGFARIRPKLETRLLSVMGVIPTQYFSRSSSCKADMESTEEKQPPVQLETVVLNSIRHSFQTLDENHSGKVAKSQLQVLCASLCFDCIGAVYDAQHLTDFKSPSTTLNFQDFMEYLQGHLLLKG